MKSLLSLLYIARGVAVPLFMLLPKTPAVMLVFAVAMGITLLSTAPPTAGLVVLAHPSHSHRALHEICIVIIIILNARQTLS